MKRMKIFVLLSLTLLLLLACSFGGGTTEEQPIEIPTLAPPPVEEQVEPPQPPPTEEAPTPEAQPAEELPAEEPPVVEEAAPAGGPLVGTDRQLGTVRCRWWTGVKNSAPRWVDVFVIDLPSAETYSYAFVDGAEYGDVYVEVDVETVKADNNGIAVICRQSDEGWYELRIATRGPNTGSYQMFRYDPSLIARKTGALRESA